MRRLLHPGWQVQRLHPAAPAIASSMAQAPHCLTCTTWVRKDIREVPFRFTIELTMRLAGLRKPMMLSRLQVDD